MKIYKAFFYTILLVIFQALAVICVFLILRLLNQHNNDYYVQNLDFFSAITQLIGFLIFFIFFWKPYKNWVNESDLKVNNTKFLFSILIIGIGYELIKSPFSDFNNLINYMNKIDLVNYSFLYDKNDSQFIYRIFSALIIAPIFEELFFRKYLITNLIKENNRIISLLISSICFSLIHFETPNNLIPTFIFGIVSGLIFLKTRKIGYTILLHFICNSLWLLDVLFDNKFYILLFNFKFNFYYWMIFILGIAMTYFGLKKITAANT